MPKQVRHDDLVRQPGVTLSGVEGLSESNPLGYQLLRCATIHDSRYFKAVRSRNPYL